MPRPAPRRAGEPVAAGRRLRLEAAAPCACSRCSSSRRSATSRPTRPSGRRSSAWCASTCGRGSPGGRVERGRVQRGHRPDDRSGTGSRGAAARAVIAEPGRRARAARARRSRARRWRRSPRSTPATRKELAAYRSRFPELSPVSRRVRRRHRHVRARLDADVQRHRQALRRLHPRLEQPGAVPRVDRPGGHRRVRRPGPAAPVVGVRRDEPRRSTTRSSCGARATSRGAARRCCATSSPQNKKVPLTPIEQTLQMTPGPATGPEAIDNVRAVPRCPARRRGSAFATSLPGVRLRRPARRRRPVLGHVASTTCAASTSSARTS